MLTGITPRRPRPWLNRPVMKRLRSSAILAALAVLVAAAPAVQGGDIYTWTDEEGVVHYGDRPSGAGTERVIHLASESTSPAPAPAPAAAAPAADPAAAPETKELTEAEKRAREQERAKQCEMYKERLQTYLTSRRLYRQGENGERIYLNEEETLAARAKVQEKIVEFCER